MAEIKIEKKRILWPWLVLGLALLALVVYFLVFRTDNKAEQEDENFALITIREHNPTVMDFVSFVREDTAKMTPDHHYTNQAILKLADAIAAMADEIDFEVKADMDKAKEHAAIITNDPSETTHADHIRKATEILSSSLQRMQQAKYPELNAEAEALQNASAAINPKTLTLDQRASVKGFFNQAADLLEKMN